jgi:hypothetical protein
VVVEGGVELAEPERPMARDQLQGGGAQADARELDRVVVRRGEGWLLGLGRATARSVGGAGPDLVAELVEAVEHEEALRADLLELLVELDQVGEGGGPFVVQALVAARDAEALAQGHGEAVASALWASLPRHGPRGLAGGGFVAVIVHVVHLGGLESSVSGGGRGERCGAVRKGGAFEVSLGRSCCRGLTVRRTQLSDLRRWCVPGRARRIDIESPRRGWRRVPGRGRDVGR